MTMIYFKRQENRKKEVVFFETIQRQMGLVRHVNESYPLPDTLLKKYLEIPSIIKAINNDIKLSTSKRLQTLEALSTLPSKVLVARSISEVSVDFTIIRNSTVQFVEFHEKQHSSLSVNRLTPIFTLNNERLEIPRFVQRLLKDVWRWHTLTNYKIVWWDWFEETKGSFSVERLLEKGKAEFCRNDSFCFSKFLA